MVAAIALVAGVSVSCRSCDTALQVARSQVAAAEVRAVAAEKKAKSAQTNYANLLNDFTARKRRTQRRRNRSNR
jgi:CCR4-NOT transcriptional regulation complex NOT5 subunit